VFRQLKYRQLGHLDYNRIEIGISAVAHSRDLPLPKVKRIDWDQRIDDGHLDKYLVPIRQYDCRYDIQIEFSGKTIINEENG
jgi:hypothetical protein